ncbi:aldo/keto reductase [Sphaerochaeta sp. PS]|uniref:aldo/keto reductase n=1 Tax=Sphaerochaeta sp. PS TaxID=3076336 RepID=UPI0028A5319F|nr:aldo/keto reductase [Sphaerochaeta sp. PS]MDT4761770.1 aldo/keto reductase [Sphaerochaeta sp. PS]
MQTRSNTMGQMHYKTLGKTGIQVSELCFGTMSFGGRADKTTSKEMYQQCRDAGINFFDCANVYQKGVAEEYLGEFIQEERHNVVITSKGGSLMADGPNGRGSSRKHLTQSLHDSLRRLRTDYLDVYFIHHYDPLTPMEEVLRTLDDFISQGKVLSVGVSNFAAWQVARMLGIGELKGLTSIHCLQPMYNIAKRQSEVELLPLAKAENLGVFSYSPLGGGLLTGRYGSDIKASAGRLVENKTYQKRYDGEFYLHLATEFTRLAKERGVEPASLAVAWVASNPAITAPILGAANPSQLQSSLASIDITIDEQLKAEIDTISPPPPPATDRSEETRA